MSTRSSPFRRAGSPSSPTAYRSSTPPSTSRHQQSPLSSPSKLKHSYTASEEEEEESMISTPTRSTMPPTSTFKTQDTPAAPASARKLPEPPRFEQHKATRSVSNTGDDISKLPPALLQSLKESFSVLDANSTGTINAADVAETLQSLGLSTNEMSQLFPQGPHQKISLPQYLNSMAAALAALSPPQELLNAFSAFDDDDSGQIDVAELKRALLTIPPEHGERPLTERDVDDALRGYTGRRILGKSATSLAGLRGVGTSTNKHGDVFKYRDFVGNVSGGPDPHQQQAMSAR